MLKVRLPKCLHRGHCSTHNNQNHALSIAFWTGWARGSFPRASSVSCLVLITLYCEIHLRVPHLTMALGEGTKTFYSTQYGDIMSIKHLLMNEYRR